MSGGSGNIDAIKVALGADLNQLRSDLAAGKKDLDAALPKSRTVQVFVKVHANQRSVADLYKSVQSQFQAYQKQGNQANSPQAIRLAPRMVVDPRVMRDFRRDIEQNMAQAARAGNALHIPIKFNGDIRGFIASMGKIEVPVWGKYMGWGPGGGPSEGGGGAPGGGSAPRPHGPTTGPTTGPTGATATGKPKTTQRAKSGGGTVVAPHSYARPGTETSSSDRYEAPDEVEVEKARRSYVTPNISGSKPPTPRQERQAARRARAQGSVPPLPRTGPANSYGRGNRATVGSNVNPAYVEPAGGRVTIGNVRSGATIQELPRGSQARAEFESQQRARPTPAHGQGPQPGEPTLSPGILRSRDEARKTLEKHAQGIRAQQAAARRASPADVSARALFASGFHNLDPDLAAMYDVLGDPEYKGSLQDLGAVSSLSKEAYGTAFHGQTTKKIRREIGIARGYKKGDVNAIDPTLLAYVSALDASREFSNTQADPLYAVRSGDQKGRGKGGKVGKIGGRNAGRMASETVDPFSVTQIIERRRIGGRGNGEKTLKAEFGPAAYSAAMARMDANRDREPIEDLVPGKAYGGFMEDAPPIQGGGGAGGRGEPKARKYTTHAEFTAAGDISRAGRPRTPAPLLHEEIAGAPVPPPTFVPGGAAGRARSSRPPRPESRAYGRNTGYTPGGSFGAGGYGGSEGFFEFLKGFKATGPGQAPTFGPRYSERIQKLMAMAGQTTQSPNEAKIAAGLLRRRGIPGFAEGGILGFREGGTLPGVPGRLLRSYVGQDSDLPRVGSTARQLLEARYLKGMREREKRQAKPTYQQGGNSDRRFRSLADAQYQKDPFCAYCGKQTVKGGGGSPNAFRADHRVDVASGGGVYDPDNIITSCNSCNSYKSGGKSARLLAPGQRVKSLTSGMAEGGWMWNKKKMRGYAEGGYVKHGGLLERMAQAGHEPSIKIVGERGPEGIVTDRNTGESEVIPTHKLAGWLQRAQEGKGFGKALDHHAEGGALRITNTGKGGQRYQAGGTFVSDVAARTGDVTRVFVVNWPVGGAAYAAGAGSAQGNPAQARAQAPGNAQGQTRQGQAGPQGPGAGAPAGAPVPGAGAGRPGRVSPLFRVEARRTGYASTDDLTERIAAARQQVTEAAQNTPVRALSVALGQIAQNRVGGRAQIQERERTAARRASRAQREVTELTSLETRRSELRAQARALRGDQTPEGQQQYGAAVQGIRELRPAIATQRGIAERRTGEAETASRGILTRGQQIKTQAVGLGGIIAGTALFSGAINAFSTATQAAATVLDPLVQTILRWPAAIDAVTSSIRDNIAAAGGNVRAGTAAAVAPSGISAAYLDAQGQNLAATGAYRAASTAGAQAQDISRAAQSRTQGLYGGVGGLLGTGIGTELFGGQAGYLETVAGRLKSSQVTSSYTAQQRAEAAQRLSTQDQPGSFYASAQAGNDQNIVRDYDKAQASPVAFADTVKDLNQNLASAAAYAGDAASAFKLVTGATDEQKKAMIASAAAISDDAKARAQEIASTGVAVVGPKGGALTGSQFGQYADQQARGQLIQDPTLLLRAQEPQRKAAAFALRAQGQFARQEDIPASQAFQNVVSPLGRYGSTFQAGGQGLEGTAGGQTTLSNIAGYMKDAAKADSAIADVNARGMAAMEKIVSRVDNPSLAGGIPTSIDGPKGQERVQPGTAGPALSAFRSDVSQIGTLGSQIQGITDSLNLRQTNLQVKEYNEQIRVSERSLGDARDLWAAINGSASKTLGGLQGQNIVLDRQNQLLGRRAQRLAFKSEDIGFKSSGLQIQAQNLGFQQTQRSINFNKAVAGFTAPGSTPEERAARIDEAKLEADFAQKQLDIQIQIAVQGREQLKIAKEQAGINRQQFGNQVKQQDNSYTITRQEAQRAITDLKKQLDLVQESRSITIDSAAAEATIERLRKEQGALVDEAQQYITQGQDVRSQVLSDTKDLMAQTGKDFSTLVTDVEKAWNDAFRSSYSNYLVPLMSSLNALGGAPSTGSGGGATKRQSQGGITTVDQPTQFMAGEAATEHVLVLRNVKQGTLQVGAGGAKGGSGVSIGSIQIIVQGSKGMDENALAAAVTERITRKLAMLGG